VGALLSQLIWGAKFPEWLGTFTNEAHLDGICTYTVYVWQFVHKKGSVSHPTHNRSFWGQFFQAIYIVQRRKNGMLT